MCGSENNVYKLANDVEGDLQRFCEVIGKYEKGELSAEEFTAFRGPRGVCEEKEDGKFMIRNRLPAGMVLAGQLRAMARVSKQYGAGWLHLSTRECIQIHSVPLKYLSAALNDLFKAGISGKDSTGNSPRNITACSNAGVCHNECFDVSPYVVGMTEFMLTPSLLRKLPRKYKIAFSGCDRDCGGATVNDLGFIATKKNGECGFRVYAGGGLGPKARVGDLLESFVPVSEIHLVAEAVKRVLDKYGERENRAKARLRHLVTTIGVEKFREYYRAELAAVKAEKLAVPDYSFSTGEAKNPLFANVKMDFSEGFDAWKNANIRCQKQQGLFTVEIPVRLGDIDADKVLNLADIIEKYGERLLRVTPRQNFQLRSVDESALPSLYKELASFNLADVTSKTIRDIISCVGNRTCRRGICFSRGLARDIIDKLSTRGPILGDDCNLSINISGCPSSCGRHEIADIGLVGMMRKIDSHSVPHYQLQLGGHLEADKTILAEDIEAIPAKNVPAFMCEFLAAFKASKEYPNFRTFLADGGRDLAQELAAKYQSSPKFEDSPEWYSDYVF
jgi:sulfite reductase beta subunit-like hemoprotein